MSYEIYQNRDFVKALKKYSSFKNQIDAKIRDIAQNPLNYGDLLKAKSFRGTRHDHITRNLSLLFSVCEECAELRKGPPIFCKGCPEDLRNKVYLHDIWDHSRLDNLR